MTETEQPKVLVTERTTAPDDKAVLETANHLPNVQVVALPPWKLAAVRMIRTWLQGVVATAPLLATGGPQAAAKATIEWLGLATPTHPFWIIMLSLFVMPMGTALISFGQNALEYFKQFDTTHPGLRG